MQIPQNPTGKLHQDPQHPGPKDNHRNKDGNDLGHKGKGLFLDLCGGLKTLITRPTTRPIPNIGAETNNTVPSASRITATTVVSLMVDAVPLRAPLLSFQSEYGQ